MPATRGRLSFDAVSFAYPNVDSPALSGIDLEIQPGETVALVGSSGSGKTTLASLVPRFYEPSAGRLLLDGVPLADIPLRQLRGHIALVSQQVELFNDTVAANIAYGREDASREEIVEAARAANAMEFIEGLPDGLETVIGENGARLSGGQRQRLAIARALLKNAPLLILDEATSALDTQSERLVQAALENLMKNRTTIVIAHRLSTIENADRIVVMHQAVWPNRGATRRCWSKAACTPGCTACSSASRRRTEPPRGCWRKATRLPWGSLVSLAIAPERSITQRLENSGSCGASSRPFSRIVCQTGWPCTWGWTSRASDT